MFAEVRALFGALPPKEVQKIKRKKKKVVADEEEEYEFVEFSGQRIVFVLGKICRMCVSVALMRLVQF